MTRVASISIKRFKRLTDVTLDLGTSTLLIGANNAGKSSALQAVQFAVSLAQSSKLVGGVNWAANRFELSFSQNQLLYCPVSDAMTLACGGYLVEDINQRVEIQFSGSDGSVGTVTLRKGRNRNLMVAIEGQTLGVALQDLNSPFSIYAPGLAGIPRHESFMSAGMVKRTVARGDANLVLRNVLLLLSQDPSKWYTFKSDMRQLFPGLELHVTFDPDHDEYISSECSLDGGPQVPLDAAGTSVLQASQILGYVTLFKPKLLVLDEPDSHLHPDRQRQLCRLISELAEQRSFQVIMSTHSRHVLDAVRKKAKVIWLHRGATVPDTDLDTTQVLLDLGALDSVDYLADGETKCIVATEDEHKEYIKALLAANGFSEDETAIVSYPGCSQVEAAIVLGSFLSEKAPHIRLVVHRDRDYLPQSEIDTFTSRLQAKGIESFVTPGSDIETCFINAPHLALLNAPVSQMRIAQLIKEVTENTRDESIRSIINLRTHHAFKMRSRGGPNIDHGQIAIDAANEFDARPGLLRRGDIVLGRLKALIQQEKGSNAVVGVPTQHLTNTDLQAIKMRIWT